MPEESFFVDIDCYQQKKDGQNTFGDCFKSKRFTDEGRLLAVLSDGLGSGIKANILATMTATMILKFIEEGKDILKAEYLLPIYIDELLQVGRVSVKVLDTNDKWFGVTYKEDKDYVVKSFAKLIEDGVYQKNLFEDLK